MTRNEKKATKLANDWVGGACYKDDLIREMTAAFDKCDARLASAREDYAESIISLENRMAELRREERKALAKRLRIALCLPSGTSFSTNFALNLLLQELESE